MYIYVRTRVFMSSIFQKTTLNLLLYLISVASWRVKETERMIAICTELRKVVFWSTKHIHNTMALPKKYWI